MILDAVGAQYGWDTATLQRLRPLLTDAERNDQQMIEAGYSKEERVAFFTEDMSRKKYNFLFGEDGLPVWKYDRFTAEDAEKVQRQGWQLEGEYEVISGLLYDRTPEPGELNAWIAHNLMNKGEQQNLGFDYLSTPRWTDARNDQEKAEDSAAKWDAATSGSSYLSGLGK